MTHPRAQHPLETDSDPLEPNGTIPFIRPTRRYPGVIRSWRPNLSETTRKTCVRSSRVHHDLRRPGALALACWPWDSVACEMGFSGRTPLLWRGALRSDRPKHRGGNFAARRYLYACDHRFVIGYESTDQVRGSFPFPLWR
jgi:hypothetical protein